VTAAARPTTPATGRGRWAPHPEGTGSPASRTLGAVLALATAGWLLLALVASPLDGGRLGMGETVRIMYVHVPVAIACYVAFFVTALASGMYLRKKSPAWDAVAAASAEVGVVFTALTLVTGSIWGHITWGTWWEWDPRLTSTALMFVLYLGYLALRRAIVDPAARAKRAAVLGLISFVNVPIVHYSVDWWRSLHQEATISRFDPTIDGLKLLALMTGMLLALGIYAWLMVHRFRLQFAQDRLEEHGLDIAIAERRAEAAADGIGPLVGTKGAS
jgi:heme exporter protein C